MAIEKRIVIQGKHFLRSNSFQKKGVKDHWAVDYAKKNPIKAVSSAATFYGLFTILAYHFHIEYSPSFDITSLAGMIFVVAYTGLSSLLAFSIGLFIPCFFVGAFCLDTKPNVTPDAIQTRIFGCFFVVFLAFEALCALLILLGIYDWSGALILLFFPAGWLLYVLTRHPLSRLPKIRKESLENAKQGETFLKRELLYVRELLKKFTKGYGQAVGFGGAMTITCALQLFSITLVFMLLKDSPDAKDGQVDWFSIALTMLWVGAIVQSVSVYLVTAWFKPGFHRKHRTLSALLAFAVPVVSSAFAGDPSFFFAATAFTTKIGNFRAAEITLTDNGCRTIASQTGSICEKLADGTNKICGVHVMSRIGSETYLMASYPNTVYDTNKSNPLKGNSSSEKDKEKKTPSHPEWVRDIYLPSKEILGIKPDQSHRFFRKQAIEEYLGKNVSRCVITH